MNRERTATQVPLAVDLDGTLIHSSVVWEGLCTLLRQRPWMAFACALWAWRGRAYWKYRMAELVALEPESLPYNANVVGFLQLERSRGRRIYLATGANQKWAEQVAAHLGLFDGVIGSTFRLDNTGERKARCCVELFGQGDYDYLGRPEESLQAMRSSRQVLSLGPLPAESGIAPEVVFPPRELSAFTFLRALRSNQWPKNLLVFLALFVSMQWTNVAAILSCAAAAAAFCMAASGCYLWNDLADLASDRRHLSKRNRPLASGRLPIHWVFVLGPLLLLGALSLASLLPPKCGVLVGAYVGGSLLYSFVGKRLAMVDVAMVAGLSLIRVYAGAAAAGLAVSSWLAIFGGCVFASLALLRRSREVAGQETESSGVNVYQNQDAGPLQTMGLTAAMASALVFAFYVVSPSASLLYRAPDWMWLACAAWFVWAGRQWLRPHAAVGYVALGVIAGSMWLAR